jgi:hypothetical protein
MNLFVWLGKFQFPFEFYPFDENNDFSKIGREPKKRVLKIKNYFF